MHLASIRIDAMMYTLPGLGPLMASTPVYHACHTGSASITPFRHAWKLNSLAKHIVRFFPWDAYRHLLNEINHQTLSSATPVKVPVLKRGWGWDSGPMRPTLPQAGIHLPRACLIAVVTGHQHDDSMQRDVRTSAAAMSCLWCATVHALHTLQLSPGEQLAIQQP